MVDGNAWVIVGSVASRDRARVTRSHLELAMERAEALVPRERIVPVVLDEHRPWWGSLLAELPEENVVVEPFDRGTAAGILVAVVRILRRDPDAEIAIIAAESVALLDDPVRAYERAHALATLSRRYVVSDDGALIVGSVQDMIGLFQASQPQLLKTYLKELSGPALFSDEALFSVYPFLPDVPFTTGVLQTSRLDAAPNAASA